MIARTLGVVALMGFGTLLCWWTGAVTLDLAQLPSSRTLHAQLAGVWIAFALFELALLYAIALLVKPALAALEDEPFDATQLHDIGCGR